MPISKIKTSSITADAASINLNIDANTLFLDVANNRVGINTVSPTATLHVYGDAAPAIQIGKSGDVGAGFQLGRDASTLNAFIIQRENADLFIRTNNAERARFTAAGNFLLRNTSQLVYDWGAGDEVSAFWNFQSSSANAPTVKTIIGSDGLGGIVGGASPNAAGNPVINSYIRFGNTSTTTGLESGHIEFRTKPATAATGAGGAAARMFISSVGNVGISTTSPSQKLTTVGNIKSAGAQNSNVANLIMTRTDASWSINNETDLRFYSGSGDTDSPSTLRMTLSSSNGNLIFSNHMIRSYVASGTLSQFTIEHAGQANGGYLKILNDGAASGQRGIRLGVNGNGSTPDSGGIDVLVVNDAGNVGIGTTSPSYKLDVYTSNANNAMRLMNINMPSIGIGPQIDFSLTQTNSQSARLAVIQSEFVSNWGGNLAFYTKTAAGSPDTSVTERMRIGSDNTIRIYSGTAGASPLLCFGSESAAVSAKAIFAEGYWLVIQGHNNEGIRFQTVNGAGTTTTRMTIGGNGATTIPGSLSKGSGSFRIEHPLPEKSTTHELVHSFIEGPQADLIYRGKVNLVAGTATVNIDTVSGMTEGTFEVLCRDVQCFTTNESDWTAVRGSVTGNILTIEAQDNTSTASISWMVIGERKDKHMYDTEWTDDDGKVIVEPLKVQPEEIAPVETE